MTIEILSRYKQTTHFIELIFKGSVYKVSYAQYTDCINIYEIMFICDNANRTDIKNTILREYETEYKQISVLLNEVN